LVVLSLLVLFTLIGVTFVLVASQSRRATRADSRHEQYGDDPRRVLDAVFGQVVRDTTNPRSSLQGHSLLADMYGNDGVKFATIGTTMTVTAVAGGQFLDLVVIGSPTSPYSPFRALAAAPQPQFNCPLSLPQIQTPGYFNGCVATLLDGPAANHSTRIVGWGYSTVTTAYTIRVMAIEGFDAASFNNNTSAILINGRPFNGTGFGFNQAAVPASDPTLLNAQQQPFALPNATPFPVDFALLPNGRHFSGFGNYQNFGGVGGADEDYDASDPQNLALAYMPITLPTAPPGPGNPSPILPSFHRPDLINYEFARAQLLDITGVTHWTQLPPALVRQSMLRPFGPGLNAPPGVIYDHPNFTGSNPDFNAIYGPWDVDNDGDGIADSVWVDMGFPVQTAPDGRRFKPLAAILCLDMDGRLNVNAHGNISPLEPNYTTLPAAIPANYYAAGGLPTLIRGHGYGPAEINLLTPLFGTTATPATYFGALLAARYREPNASLTTSVYPAATSPYPGVTTVDDPLSAIKQVELPVNSLPNLPTSFGTPTDIWGRGALALDVRGTPLTPYMGNPTDTVDDPYELNLSRKVIRGSQSPAATSLTSPADAPFSAAELERILRMYDVDASSLPNGLRAIVDPTNANLVTLRKLITTDSSDLPSPGISPTRDLGTVLKGQSAAFPQVIPTGLHIVDLLRARLIVGRTYPPVLTPAQIQQLNADVAAMLPAELVAGLRLDLNRPFGNSRDDNGNGVVDEPLEAGSEPGYWTTPSTAPANFALIPPNLANGVDVNNNGTFGDAVDARLARHLYARQLYVLMMLFNDQATVIDFDGDGNSNPEETARGIAQWAVNVVDFRDRYSIMTPFEYDMDPFDGWGVDGDITTNDADPDRRVVWGCERPELLITETLAFHDRRTEDLNSPESTITAANGTGQDAPDGATRNFDQRLLPRGSLFIELYNPWNTQTSTLNNGFPSLAEAQGEFYDVAANVANGNVNQPTPQVAAGVQLNARTPGQTPVWRCIIVRGASMLADPDDFGVAPNPPFLPADVERSVYFANPQFVNDLATIANHYTTLPVAPLMPGRFAVVGSAGQPGLNTASEFITPIGRLNANFGAASDGASAGVRQIVLSPNASPLANQVELRNNFGPNPEPTGTGDLLPAVAVVVDSTWNGAATVPLSMSVSEPLGGYNTALFNPVLANGEGAFGAPLNTPLDEGNPELRVDGTRLNHRTVHLQRLADPTLDWNATSNPYLTIDSMTVDLTVFNGVADPSSAKDPQTSGTTAGVASYQRGDPPALNLPVNTFWAHQLANPAIPAGLVPGGGSTHIVNFALQHSLGYLNKGYGVAALGTAYTQGDAPFAAYVGAPKAPLGPFPWFTWNNRPFAGPNELLLVPRSRSSRLLFDFNSTPSSYAAVPAATPAAGVGHLLDFFQTGTVPASTTHFYRLLDYVQVPSPFVGTESVLNPQAFTPPLPSASGLTETQMMSFYHPPFNKVSNYRDPGRVNVNTIPSDAADYPGVVSPPSSTIWNSVVNSPSGFASPFPTWQQVVLSRQGQDPSGRTPTWFANPFRTPAGAALTLPGAPTRNERDVSLLRGVNPAVPAALPLFSYQQLNGVTDDPIKNTYFQIANLQRLSNLLTTRSNVYAVWVTVGFFEVSPVAVDPAHPDGFTLGQEIGSETGEIKRPRAFYIFDRSIPVGFEPGKDHNIDQGTLIKRFIE
jgi:hypothetical protein